MTLLRATPPARQRFLVEALFTYGSISSFTQSGGVENFNSIVLFGGALGALYSFLQFVAAPLWGGLSDKWGRRPILLISVLGLALSYLLWFFSGSFTLLILARFIGGIMGGNISTATAVVAERALLLAATTDAGLEAVRGHGLHAALRLVRGRLGCRRRRRLVRGRRGRLGA